MIFQKINRADEVVRPYKLPEGWLEELKHILFPDKKTFEEKFEKKNSIFKIKPGYQ